MESEDDTERLLDELEEAGHKFGWSSWSRNLYQNDSCFTECAGIYAVDILEPMARLRADRFELTDFEPGYDEGPTSI